MKTQSKKLNFSNQDFYIGIDVHKHSWSVTIRSNNMTLKTFRMNPSPRELSLFMEKRYPQGNYYSLLTQKKGYKKYIKTEEEVKSKELKISIDEKRIKNESRFDCYSAKEYSREDLHHDEVIQQYHNLYRIEESFRILKSTMRTRPIYI